MGTRHSTVPPRGASNSGASTINCYSGGRKLVPARGSGLQADRRRLFVIDGAKALRSAICHVFGQGNLVQRCRNHKVRNVVGHLPKTQHEQARSTLRAAWKLDADEGIRKVEQYAAWLEREWPSAAASLREGLAELFTVNRRLGLPAALRRCGRSSASRSACA